MAFEWSGNVRELENVVERSLVLSAGRPVDEQDVELTVRTDGEPIEFFDVQRRQFEHRYLKEMLARFNGNITHAARAAGKSRRAFFELLRKHKLI